MKKFKNIKLIDVKNGVSRIILDDPKTYNSLSLDTINSLIEVFKILNQDKKSKVIIIEGEGKGFCAGHNLEEINSLKGKFNFKKLFIWKELIVGNKINKIDG